MQSNIFFVLTKNSNKLLHINFSSDEAFEVMLYLWHKNAHSKSWVITQSNIFIIWKINNPINYTMEKHHFWSVAQINKVEDGASHSADYYHSEWLSCDVSL